MAIKDNIFEISSKEKIAMLRGDAPSDFSTGTYSKIYGNYVQTDLVSQINKKVIEQMTTNPMTISVSIDGINKEKKKEKKENPFKEVINTIHSRIDWNQISSDLEKKLTWERNSVVAFNDHGNKKVDLFVPDNTITRLDPITKELNWLHIIRFIQGGDMINVISEMRTLDHTIFKITNLGEGVDAPTSQKDLEKTFDKDGNNGSELSGKELEDFLDLHPSLAKIKFNIEIPNTDGFIHAQYFQNLPTLDRRGELDIELHEMEKTVSFINKLYIRKHWEIDFNKSKFIRGDEIGTSPFANQNKTDDAMIRENFLSRKNSFLRPLGDGGAGFEYFETNNQNLQNIQFIFNHWVKKFWEMAGSHMSADDQQGKNITTFGSKLERERMDNRLQKKVTSRIWNYKRLLWKIFSVTLPSEMKNITFDDIKIGIIPFRTIDMKEFIANEIIKVQADLSTNDIAIKNLTIGGSLTDDEAEKLANEYLKTNNERIKEKLQAMPIQEPNAPNMNNPAGATKQNNQIKSFQKQGQGK